MKENSKSLVTRERQTKNTRNIHLAQSERPIIKKTEQNNIADSGEREGEKELSCTAARAATVEMNVQTPQRA